MKLDRLLEIVGDEPVFEAGLLLAAFGARGVDRVALASLLLFQQACVEGRVTLEMIHRLAAELRRWRPELP